MRKTNILLIVLITIFMSSFAYAVPKLINYQGQLTDSNGNLLDGTYITKFYLFSEEVGGTSLWIEQQELTVTDGIYNVQLGAVNPLAADLFDNESLYLEVEIFNADTGWEILSPRQHITSTAFAINADLLDGKHANEFLDISLNTQTKSGGLNINGKVGIGTTSPNSKLHVEGTTYIKQTGSDTYVYLASGSDGIYTYATRRGIYARANSSYGAISARQMNASGKAIYSYCDYDSSFNIYAERGKNYFSGNVGIGSTNPAGKLDVNGAIYQRGSQLHADYVFESEYKLESIEEHSKYMWTKKHLKAIPKVKIDENGKEIVEVGLHQRGIVEELEKAHIYIEQLNKRINEMEGLIAKNKALETLVSKLSTRIEALESNN